ncbi:MAG: GNAT family N-acetyltransferase [Planctomycetota bacterium]
MEISEMNIEDYEEVISLWQNVEGVGLHDDADSKEAIERYLHRNPGLSFVARYNGKLIGAVLCGHDSRRGHLYHLAVARTHRKKGIGKALVEQVISKFKSLDITKCHVFVFADNLNGQKFWESLGWSERTDLKIMSKDID